MTHGSTARLLVLSLILGIAAGALTACSQTPQERYKHANEQLQQAQKNRNQAQKKVNAKQAELAKSQEKLNKAESRLQAARQKVQEASQAVDKTVNDAMLFRTLQAKLVNRDHFGTSAISVTVRNRVVTLSGTVPDKDTRQRAVKIARSQAGVQQVVDHLQIAPAANGQNGGDHAAASQSSSA